MVGNSLTYLPNYSERLPSLKAMTLDRSLKRTRWVKENKNLHVNFHSYPLTEQSKIGVNSVNRPLPPAYGTGYREVLSDRASAWYPCMPNSQRFHDDMEAFIDTLPPQPIVPGFDGYQTALDGVVLNEMTQDIEASPGFRKK